MDGSPTQGKKKLGLILQEAGLIAPAQLEVAIDNQKYFNYLIGEIIALHGWVNKDTIDFFAEHWCNLIQGPNLLPLGHYLRMASLLDYYQISEILIEQKKLGLRFGATAVLMGWLKQETVDYFIANLKSEMINQSPFSSYELIGDSLVRVHQIKSTNNNQHKNTNNDQCGKELCCPREGGVVANDEPRIIIPEPIIELPLELAKDLPDNFHIFIPDDESLDLADVVAMDEDIFFEF